MSLSKKAIQEFKDLYRKEFNEEISDEKARELGERLISLFRVICRPIPEADRNGLGGNEKSEPT